MRVFFSHNSRDYAWINPIVEQVNTMGMRGYVYEHDPQPGTKLAPKIKSAITRSDILVAFLTLNGHDAPYVQQEIGYALSKGKVVIPFVEKNVPERSLAMLQGVERIVFDPSESQIAIMELLVDLARRAVQQLSDTGLLLDEIDETQAAEVVAPTPPSHPDWLTPPLVTMSVNIDMKIDRETLKTLLELALLIAAAAFAAYLIIENAKDTGTGFDIAAT